MENQASCILSDSNERYMLIVENLADVVMTIGSDDTIYFMNRKGLEKLGVEASYVVGKSYKKFLADEKSDQAISKAFHRILATGKPMSLVISVKTIDGIKTWKITLGFLGNSRDEVICVASDITERKINLRRLSLLANIEYYSADAIIGLDLDRTIISWNRGAEMMFGWTEDEIIGSHAYIIIPESERTESDNLNRVVIDKGFIKDFETRRMTKSGKILDVSLTLTVLKDETGNMFGFSAIIKDISNNKKMEAALVRSERLAATGKLSASIAHEINNPLYGIRSCLSHVMNVPSDKIDMQFVRLALKEADRIADLIRNMKAFYMPSEGMIKPTDINELLREVFIFNSKYLEEHGVRLQFDKGDCLELECVSDYLKQVFLNIMTNAVEAMPEGGILSVKTLFDSDNEELAVSFEDNGVGISSEDLPNIFEMFYSKKTNVKGVGLGLSVSYGIVKQHGGRIEVESEKGRGTVFKVLLPIKTGWGRQMQLDLK